MTEKQLQITVSEDIIESLNRHGDERAVGRNAFRVSVVEAIVKILDAPTEKLNEVANKELATLRPTLDPLQSVVDVDPFAAEKKERSIEFMRNLTKLKETEPRIISRAVVMSPLKAIIHGLRNNSDIVDDIQYATIKSEKGPTYNVVIHTEGNDAPDNGKVMLKVG